MGDVLYPASQRAEAIAAAAIATADELEQMRVFDIGTDAVLLGRKSFATVAERFTARQRREHGKINSYNPIIAFCTRSNMDIKALLSDFDARGALFYILNYSTKTETTMDALLNVLAPVVERIKDETDGAPAAVIAAHMVRSCSCKTVAHMSLGAPAAASKVLGYSDAKCSTDTNNCPMGPLLTETSAFFDAVTPSSGQTTSNDVGDEGSDGDNDNVTDDDACDKDVMLSTSGGRITLSTRMHDLYVRRCRADDSTHPYYGLSYAVWTRLVRVINSPTTTAPVVPANDESDDDVSDSESIDDEYDTPPPASAQKRGRCPATRHDFVGLPSVGKQQVIMLLLRILHLQTLLLLYLFRFSHYFLIILLFRFSLTISSYFSCS